MLDWKKRRGTMRDRVDNSVDDVRTYFGGPWLVRVVGGLLGVYLLARYAGFGAERLDLQVVPLFETIEDLRNAPGILSDLLKVPLARRSAWAVRSSCIDDTANTKKHPDASNAATVRLRPGRRARSRSDMRRNVNAASPESLLSFSRS